MRNPWKKMAETKGFRTTDPSMAWMLSMEGVNELLAETILSQDGADWKKASDTRGPWPACLLLGICSCCVPNPPFASRSTCLHCWRSLSVRRWWWRPGPMTMVHSGHRHSSCLFIEPFFGSFFVAFFLSFCAAHRSPFLRFGLGRRATNGATLLASRPIKSIGTCRAAVVP